MHMADALISPVVGGTMWTASIGLAAYSMKKIQNDIDEQKVPLMGVMGAFVFAAQMINFTIPATGSSGHIGGGMLLAILLGPYAGFLTMLSILTIQALFFADGGILSLGCNVFNMGFYTCFIVYPLIYKNIIKKGYSKSNIFKACMLSCIIGLQFGAFSVVMETVTSGISQLPFKTFVTLMQPIHLAISIGEGLMTSAIIAYIWQSRPEILEKAALGEAIGSVSIKKVATTMAILAVLTGGILSWYASSNPDGLEWAMGKITGEKEITSSEVVHKQLGEVQGKTAFMPDYNFKNTQSSQGTSIAGIVGGGLTLALAGSFGVAVHSIKKRKSIHKKAV